MEFKELMRIKEQLNNGLYPTNVNWNKVKEELDELLKYQPVSESLALSSQLCPACGRPL